MKSKFIIKILTAMFLIVVYLLISSMIFGKTCPVQILIGMPCPGCGASRSLGLLLRGELRDSFKMYPLLIPWLLYIIFQTYNHVTPSKPIKIRARFTVLIVVSTWIIFILRCFTSFGTDPLTIYEHSLLGQLVVKLNTLIY